MAGMASVTTLQGQRWGTEWEKARGAGQRSARTCEDSRPCAVGCPCCCCCGRRHSRSQDSRFGLDETVRTGGLISTNANRDEKTAIDSETCNSRGCKLTFPESVVDTVLRGDNRKSKCLILGNFFPLSVLNAYRRRTRVWKMRVC